MQFRDLREGLARASWSIGRRAGDPTGATLHFNGPPVVGATDVAACIRQLQADARYHMRPNAFGPGAAGDGIMYHYAPLPDGSIGILRDERDELWHSANTTGNRTHLAIHVPIGGAQAPTPAQWRACTDLFDALIARYGWPGRQVILGHREWPRSDGKPQKPCPGPILFRMLQAWRGQLPALATYRVAYDGTRVRQGAGQQYPVALNGTAVLPRGREIRVDAIVEGTAPAGSADRRWAHLANAIGFVHLSLVERV